MGRVSAGVIAFLMNSSLSFKFLSAALLAGVVIAFTNTSHAAERTRSKSGTYQGSTGKSGSFQKTTTRSPGQRERSGSWTSQDGKTGTRASTRRWDKTTGTGTVNASATRPDGQSASREGTLTKTGENTVQAQGTATGFNGRTGTYAATTTKTDTGRTTTGTVTGENGKVSTFDTTVTKGNATTSRATTTTSPAGKTTERVVGTTLNGDGTSTRTIEVTKPDGTTETRSQTFTVTPDGAGGS
jgi:hypothetical protein